VKRALLVLAAALGLFGCGSAYTTGGACVGDADCQLCAVCECERVYSLADLKGASCEQVAKDESCPKSPRDGCLSGHAYQPLCVSGFCQAVQR
jgi:hypothetical protein